MVLGKDRPKTDIQALRKRIAALDAKVSNARKNLVHISAKNIPAAEAEIADLEDQAAVLQSQLKNQPTEAEISTMVLALLRHIARLTFLGADAEPEMLRPILQAIESIEIDTSVTGKGSGRRHSFCAASIEFAQVGGVTGRSNPQHPWF